LKYFIDDYIVTRQVALSSPIDRHVNSHWQPRTWPLVINTRRTYLAPCYFAHHQPTTTLAQLEAYLAVSYV